MKTVCVIRCAIVASDCGRRVESDGVSSGSRRPRLPLCAVSAASRSGGLLPSRSASRDLGATGGVRRLSHATEWFHLPRGSPIATRRLLSRRATTSRGLPISRRSIRTTSVREALRRATTRTSWNGLVRITSPCRRCECRYCDGLPRGSQRRLWRAVMPASTSPSPGPSSVDPSWPDLPLLPFWTGPAAECARRLPAPMHGSALYSNRHGRALSPSRSGTRTSARLLDDLAAFQSTLSRPAVRRMAARSGRELRFHTRSRARRTRSVGKVFQPRVCTSRRPAHPSTKTSAAP